MLIYLKNKNKLIIDDFVFKCSLGKGGTTNKKIEGDLKTPIGKYEIGSLYYRADRIQKIFTKLKKIKIKKKIGWCNDINSKKYKHKSVKWEWFDKHAIPIERLKAPLRWNLQEVYEKVL